MRKIFVFPFAILVSSFSQAQKPIDDLIAAEKNFAAYSVAHGTKEAFLKFADSSAIVFDQGKPVNAIQYWMKKEKRAGVLNWLPDHAGIAYSNDFGYTTGPWTFTMKDSIVARGNYTTVWHKNASGAWKFVVDLGVSNTPPFTDTFVTKIENPVGDFQRGTLKSLLKTEKKFIRDQRAASEKYLKFMSADCILKRNGREPASFRDAYSRVLNSMPKTIIYTPNGSGIATTGDLGYVFGTTVINDKTDNYLRIWRKQNNDWKMALEVIRY